MIMNCGWKTRQRSAFCLCCCAKLCRNVIFSQRDRHNNIHSIYINLLIDSCWRCFEKCWSLMHLSCRSFRSNILIRKFSWSPKNIECTPCYDIPLNIQMRLSLLTFLSLKIYTHLYRSGHWDTIKEMFRYFCCGIHAKYRGFIELISDLNAPKLNVIEAVYRYWWHNLNKWQGHFYSYKSKIALGVLHTQKTVALSDIFESFFDYDFDVIW